MNDKPEATETPQGDQQASQTETTQDNSGQTTEATFTQADLDRILGERLKREREKLTRSFLDELDVESLDDLKAAQEAERQRKEAEMSEVEKANARAEKAQADAKAAQEAMLKMQAQLLADKRKAKFETALRDNGSTNTERVYKLLQMDKPNDFLAVFEDETAEYQDAKMARLIKQVQTDYSEYFGNAGAGSTSMQGTMSPNSKDDLTDMQQRVRNNVKGSF